MPIVAVAAVALLAASMAANSRASAHAPGGANGVLAPGVKVSAHPLKGRLAGQQAVARIMGRRPAAGGAEPGGASRPAGVPSSGKYAFLLKLAAGSTLSAYRVAVPHGKSVASAAARTQFRQVKAAQSRVVSALPTGSRVLYRTHSVLAGVAVYTDVRNFAALTGISGVQAVYPIAPKGVSNAYAVPLQGAPTAWTAHGDLGENATVAVIDTGIDYTHANFGGPGTVAAYTAARATDAAPANPAEFPSAKVIDGFDLVGDTYNADPTDPSTFQPIPAPDPNPLDCGGHGSHVAGIAAGYGVTSGGSTFAGPYTTSTPFSALRIGPGMAPQAKLLAYKVFGCAGSTQVVGAAIDMASDPNGDGDPSDHASVINMSLGTDFASPGDGDSVTANDASTLGISVVTSAGNGGDVYDIGGSPGDAAKTIAVANSVDASNQIDTLHVSAPAGIAGGYGAQRSEDYDYVHEPDLSGTVAPPLSAANADGCDPLSPADAALVAGKIAFLEWTDATNARRCGSAARSGNVASAGAVGFIFADDAESFAAGISGSAVIPGVEVVKSAGDTIRAQLANGVVVSGTSRSDFSQPLILADNDKVNESSSRGIRGAGEVKPDVTAVGTSVFSTASGTGNEGVSFTGTSMAAPMVAGLSALVRSLHPDWTPEEVKADIMNTAGQDLFTGDNHTGDTFAPNRVGAGRIEAGAALDNSVLAFVRDDPGAVSVSFGPVAVTGPVALTKTIKVVNKGLSPVTYDVAYQPVTSVPGVGYTVSAPSITVSRLSTKTFTVSFVVTNPTLLTKTIDATVEREQGGLPREYVADASGRLVLTPTTGSLPSLRVPVYSAPRPASQMTQSASLRMPNGGAQQAVLALSGHPVSQGSGVTAVRSIVSGFELEAISGAAPTCSVRVTTRCVHSADERSADLKYIGVTSDATQLKSIGHDPETDGRLYFSVTTQGPWRTAASTQEFDILIDTDGDNLPDAAVFNTRLTQASSDQDIMVSETVDLNTGTVLDLEPIDGRLGDTDTALFDSDTLVLPVAIGTLPGVTGPSQRIHYGVASFSNEAAASVDSVGVADDGTLAHPLSVNPFRPGVAVFGSFDGSASPLLFSDAPGSVLAVRRDRTTYALDHGQGALLVHFQNKVGAKAQRMALKSRSSESMKLSPTTAKFHAKVTATVAVSNTGLVPTGTVDIRHVGGGVFASARLSNGRLTVRFTPRRRGTYQVRAEYHGDNNYLAGDSANVSLTVR